MRIRVIDTVETYRDMVSGMPDVYLSSVSSKTVSYTHLTLPTTPYV